MFNKGSSFNMQQLVEHHNHLCKQWKGYTHVENISAEKVGGAAAYEAHPISV